MKKILAYTLVAVLFGVVTMLAPFGLFAGEIDTQDEWSYARATSETEKAYGITPATYSPDIIFVVFMLALSLITALGVMLHFKRKTVF